MTGHIVDLLPEFALGMLDDPERGKVAAHVASCDVCAAELQIVQGAAETVTLSLRPIAPPRELRARILETAAAGASRGRFAPFVDRIASLTDQPINVVSSALDSIDEPSAWEPGPTLGCAIIHLPKGPALADALVGFVRVESGVRFPVHRHLGDEVVIILQGALCDEDGALARRGEVVTKGNATSHWFDAVGPIPLVYFVRLEGGVEFPGLPDFQV